MLRAPVSDLSNVYHRGFLGLRRPYPGDVSFNMEWYCPGQSMGLLIASLSGMMLEAATLAQVA